VTSRLEQALHFLSGKYLQRSDEGEAVKEKMNQKRFQDKRVVITGASSGIGRATALAFAKEGADLALIARSAEGLATLANEIRSLGRRAFVFPIDISDEDEVRYAISEIVRYYGGLDIWVNNAATSVYGEYHQIPIRDMRRVMEVNFFAQVNCTREAVPHLQRSPGGGHLIGVLSIESEIGLPLTSIYSASKHALYGFYKVVYQELLAHRAKVHLSTLMPASIDTPFFVHSKTYLGVQPKPIPPIYTPEDVARAILKRAIRPKFLSQVGTAGRIAVFLQRAFPSLSLRFFSATGYHSQKTSVSKTPTDRSNLDTPMPDTSTTHGAFSKEKPSRASEFKTLPLLLAFTGGVASYLWWKKPIDHSKKAA
jgi:short-subunit dehydrogenase